MVAVKARSKCSGCAGVRVMAAVKIPEVVMVSVISCSSRSNVSDSGGTSTGRLNIAYM
ncbi:Uncharacterised protein [Mycobacteroides abscessus subsp. abscessus]|nr:Uncharacterised protein [Mycobacteroides abscessus subsp. abscessus]